MNNFKYEEPPLAEVSLPWKAIFGLQEGDLGERPGREVQDIDKLLSLGSPSGIFSYPSPLFGANIWTQCYLLGSQMGKNDGVESAALIYTCTPAQAQPQLLLADRFEKKTPI